MNNSFVKLLLDTLGITEAQTVELSKIMDAEDIQPCITRDVLQPALKGEKVGERLVPIMQFKALEAFCKRAGLNVADFKPHTVNDELYFGELQ